LEEANEEKNDLHVEEGMGACGCSPCSNLARHLDVTRWALNKTNIKFRPSAFSRIEKPVSAQNKNPNLIVL